MSEAFAASLIFSAKNISIVSYNVVKLLTSWPLNELVKLTMLWTIMELQIGVPRT